MTSPALALALLAALAAPAAAQDGGKIVWTGKGMDPVAPAYADAIAAGRPMLLLFSVEGNKECIELSNGALSHPDVVEAAAQFTCIFVECGNHRNATLVKQANLTKFPTIVLADGHGDALGTAPADAAGLTAALRQVSNRATLRPNFQPDLDKALAAARKTGRPLLIYFFDDSPATVTMNTSLADPEVKPLRERFELAMAQLQRGSAVAAKYDVDRAPTLLVLNPRLGRPEEKPLARITVARSPRELRRDLEEALEAARAPAAEASTPPSTVPLPAPREHLSDDEIDRKFIQARLAYAANLQKQGMKAKAIDVLEDLLQSYPKHVLTKSIKDALDELKK